MQKYIVTVSALFIAGIKYRRGDIVELADARPYGTNVDVYVEPKADPVVEEKPRRTRRKVIEANYENR